MPCKCGYSTTVDRKWRLYLCVTAGRYTFVLHLAHGGGLDRPMESCKETFKEVGIDCICRCVLSYRSQMLTAPWTV